MNTIPPTGTNRNARNHRAFHDEPVGVIGQIVCLVVVLFGGVWVSGAGVEFVPVDAGSVSVGYAERFVCALGAPFPMPCLWSSSIF
ncbi:hypothetical protein, partial [Bifidobacterium tsurumiense]|uniref:hypothetical protein n=1 Tax=Bifidobacterium tsurumiense TaxID=356829 RepID=UPI0005C66A39